MAGKKLAYRAHHRKFQWAKFQQQAEVGDS